MKKLRNDSIPKLFLVWAMADLLKERKRQQWLRRIKIGGSG